MFVNRINLQAQTAQLEVHLQTSLSFYKTFSVNTALRMRLQNLQLSDQLGTWQVQPWLRISLNRVCEEYPPHRCCASCEQADNGV